MTRRFPARVFGPRLPDSPELLGEDAVLRAPEQALVRLEGAGERVPRGFPHVPPVHVRPSRRRGAGAPLFACRNDARGAPRRLVPSSCRREKAPKRFVGSICRPGKAPRRFVKSICRHGKAPRRFVGSICRREKAPRRFVKSFCRREKAPKRSVRSFWRREKAPKRFAGSFCRLEKAPRRFVRSRDRSRRARESKLASVLAVQDAQRRLGASIREERTARGRPPGRAATAQPRRKEDPRRWGCCTVPQMVHIVCGICDQLGWNVVRHGGRRNNRPPRRE